MTVSHTGRIVESYTRVLGFEKVSDTEVWGEEYDRLVGLARDPDGHAIALVER